MAQPSKSLKSGGAGETTTRKSKSKPSDSSLVVQTTQCDQLTGEMTGSLVGKVEKTSETIGGDKYLDNLLGDIHTTATQDGDEQKRKSKEKMKKTGDQTKSGTLDILEI